MVLHLDTNGHPCILIFNKNVFTKHIAECLFEWVSFTVGSSSHK